SRSRIAFSSWNTVGSLRTTLPRPSSRARASSLSCTRRGRRRSSETPRAEGRWDIPPALRTRTGERSSGTRLRDDLSELGLADGGEAHAEEEGLGAAVAGFVDDVDVVEAAQAGFCDEGLDREAPDAAPLVVGIDVDAPEYGAEVL